MSESDQNANQTTEASTSKQGAFSQSTGEEQGGQSGNYTPPATQAEFDQIIGERVARERQKFAGWDEIKAKADEYDKVVEANKTEQERKDEALKQAQDKVAEYEQREQVRQWADEVSEDTGVAADVLRGSSKEEMQAHAEQLQKLITKAEPDHVPGSNSVPTIGTEPAPPRSATIDEQITAAEQAGNRDLVSALKAQKLGTP